VNLKILPRESLQKTQDDEGTLFIISFELKVRKATDYKKRATYFANIFGDINIYMKMVIIQQAVTSVFSTELTLKF
jgi:hypothetical protein